MFGTIFHLGTIFGTSPPQTHQIERRSVSSHPDAGLGHHLLDSRAGRGHALREEGDGRHDEDIELFERLVVLVPELANEIRRFAKQCRGHMFPPQVPLMSVLVLATKRLGSRSCVNGSILSVRSFMNNWRLPHALPDMELAAENRPMTAHRSGALQWNGTDTFSTTAPSAVSFCAAATTSALTRGSCFGQSRDSTRMPILSPSTPFTASEA
jgi:hypothetical protein